MKYNILLTGLMCLLFNMQAAELTQLTSVHAPRGERLFTDGMDYFVQHEGRTSKVPTWYTSSELRGRDLTTLAAMQQAGYVDVHQMHGDAYRLDFKPRGKGGGPICGSIAYWVTKTLCYGTAVAGTGALIVATGGVAGAVTSVAVTTTTLGAGTAVTLTGSAIVGAGLATEAALVTTGAVAATGGVAGAIATVEAVSAGVGSFFWLIPFLP